MKLITLVLCFGFVTSAYSQEAEPCDEEACQQPDCRCSSTNIPGGLNARDTPQFFTLTFDDAITVTNIGPYREILDGKLNSKGCTAAATFYVSHEYTDYTLANELYNSGHEIALHSMSHQTNQDYWRNATYETMVSEFVDQRLTMATFANIPLNEIQGLRMPFLQVGADAPFEVIRDYNFTYDCSMPTINQIDPGLWPYTLDYASTQDCVIGPCPTASIPGAWVLPLISWIDLNGTPCSFTDACFTVPEDDDEDGWFSFILDNFERQYLGNRAPFGLYIHEAYLRPRPAVQNAIIRFIDMVNTLPDVFMVKSLEVIDWVRNPVPIDEYRSQPCSSFQPTTCNPNSCGPLSSSHTELQYYMQACTACPANYPWLDNPTGL